MKKILLLTAMIVAGMMTTSCSSDNDGVEQQTNNDAGVIALKAEVVPMNTLLEGERTSSRVITPEYENTISNIHIVAFGADGNKIFHVYSPMYMENPYTTLLNLGSEHAGERVKIYAIANVGDADLFNTTQNGVDNTVANFELLNLRPVGENIAGNITAGNLILKAGNGTSLATISNSSSPIMVATLNVTVSNNGLTSATLRFVRQDTKVSLNIIPQNMKVLKYKIGNIPKISYLFSHDENVNNVEYMDMPYTDIPAADQTKTIKASYHVFENYKDIAAGLTKQMERTDANAPANATYVDIIGIPDGYTDSYRYRVYLGGVDIENAVHYDKFSLYRNYEYYLTVKIAGDGTGDPRVSKVE